MGSVKFNKLFIIRITLVSAMGGLLFGYDWVVIGGAKPFYERFFDITHSANLQGWAMSSALIGCLFGALFSGFVSDRFGRKLPLILAAVLFTLSAIGTGAVNHFTPFIVYRMVGGLAIGMASAISPMYISEIFPNRIRGSAMAIATTALWSASFILIYTFPLLNKTLNASGTFWLYAFICVAGFMFIYRRLPETKGISLEKIEKIMSE